MKNILYIIDTTGPGGAERVLYNLVSNIDKNQFKAWVVLPDKGWPYHEFAKQSNISVTSLPSKGKFNLRLLLHLVHIILKYEIDIIHTHLFGTALYGCLAGWFTRKPVICTFHGIFDFRKNDPYLSIKFYLINRICQYMVFVSEYLCEYFNQYSFLNKSKCLVIYNGSDCDRIFNSDDHRNIKTKYHIGENTFVIGAVGNIKPIKGYSFLINAFHLFHSHYTDSKLFIIGLTDHPEYLNLVTQCTDLGLREDIFFTGYIEKVSAYYKIMDLYVCSSFSEGFSLTTIEALTNGIPVIATKSGGPEEIFAKLRHGIIINSFEPTQLANEFTKVYTNYNTIKESFLKAQLKVNVLFGLQTMINHYQNLYNDVGR